MQRLLPLFLLLLSAIVDVRADTVLVVPFFNVSTSANLDWIGESIAQTVSEALDSGGVLVLKRDDRQEAYRRMSIRPNAHLTHASVIKVAEALDATDVVYGQFDYTPGSGEGSRGSLQITAWTLNMARMRKGPDFIESGPLDDLASLQSHLSWRILGYLAPDSTPSEKNFLEERPPVRLDAMENYTRGLLATSPEQKHRFFTQAARLDERFPQPVFELGRLYWEQKEYRLAAGWFAKVRPPAPRYFEASFLLGLCRYYLGDFEGAQRAFATVAEAVPLNEVFNDLGAAQSKRGLPEAVESFRKALEGDPADPDYQFNLGLALWRRGRFDEAATQFRAALARDPEDAESTLLLGRCLKGTGPEAGEAREDLERLKLNYEEGAWHQLKAALEAGKPKQGR